MRSDRSDETMRRRLRSVSVPAGCDHGDGGVLVSAVWALVRTEPGKSCCAQRGIAVDRVTIYRWAQRFTPLLIDAPRPCRHTSREIAGA